MILLIPLITGLASCPMVNSLTSGLSTDVCHDGKRTNCVPFRFPVFDNGTLYLGLDSVILSRLQSRLASNRKTANSIDFQLLQFVYRTQHHTSGESIPVSYFHFFLEHSLCQDWILDDFDLSLPSGTNFTLLINSDSASFVPIDTSAYYHISGQSVHQACIPNVYDSVKVEGRSGTPSRIVFYACKPASCSFTHFLFNHIPECVTDFERESHPISYTRRVFDQLASLVNSTLLYLHNNNYVVNMYTGCLSAGNVYRYLEQIFHTRPNVFINMDLLNDVYKLNDLISHLLLHTLFMTSKVVACSVEALKWLYLFLCFGMKTIVSLWLNVYSFVIVCPDQGPSRAPRAATEWLKRAL